MSILSKIFKSYSEKEVKRIMPLVNKINGLEEEISKLTDSELRAKTNYFKEQLNKSNTKLWLRQVIIPGINDTEEYILELKEYIKEFNNVEKVELLPYHTLGLEKYKKLNIKYELEDTLDMDKERCKELEELLYK